MSEPCPEPVWPGRPCRMRRLAFAATCLSHMSDTQRAAMKERRTRAQAIVDRWRANLRPACMGWPVLGADLATAAEIMADGGDEYRQACRGADLLWMWQESRCGICGFGWAPMFPPDDEVRWPMEDFVLDHDHQTALIRGWLCRSCNISEGCGDDPVLAWYRRRHPAAMLGVAVRYWSDWGGWAVPEADYPKVTAARDPAIRLLEIIRPPNQAADQD